MCRLVPEATLLTKVWVSKVVCRSVCPNGMTQATVVVEMMHFADINM